MGAYWYYFYEFPFNDVEMLLVAGTGAAQGHRANQAGTWAIPRSGLQKSHPRGIWESYSD